MSMTTPPYGVVNFGKCGVYQVTLPRHTAAEAAERHMSSEHLWELRYFYHYMSAQGAFSGYQKLCRVMGRWLGHSRWFHEEALGTCMPKCLPTRFAMLHKIIYQAHACPTMVVNAAEQATYVDTLPCEIEVPTSVLFAALVARVVPGGVGKPVASELRRQASRFLASFLNEVAIETEMKHAQMRCPGADLHHRLGSPYLELHDDSRMPQLADVLGVLQKLPDWNHTATTLRTLWARELDQFSIDRLVEHSIDQATLGEFCGLVLFYADELVDLRIGVLQMVCTTPSIRSTSTMWMCMCVWRGEYAHVCITFVFMSEVHPLCQ